MLGNMKTEQTLICMQMKIEMPDEITISRLVAYAKDLQISRLNLKQRLLEGGFFYAKNA